MMRMPCDNNCNEKCPGNTLCNAGEVGTLRPETAIIVLFNPDRSRFKVFGGEVDQDDEKNIKYHGLLGALFAMEQGQDKMDEDIAKVKAVHQLADAGLAKGVRF